MRKLRVYLILNFLSEIKTLRLFFKYSQTMVVSHFYTLKNHSQHKIEIILRSILY